MATTIVSTPQLFSPSGNPSIFNLMSSNSLYFVYYLVEIKKTDSTSLGIFKYYGLPNYKNGVVFNLSSILSSYIDYQLVNSNNIIEPVPNILMSYRLTITEYIAETITAGNTVQPTGKIVQSGNPVFSNIFNVWCGELSRIKMPAFNYLDYTLGTSTATKFLTDKPLVNNVYKNSVEYLYLLNNSSGYLVTFKFYGAGNKLIGNQTIALTTDKAMRLDVSPSTIANYYGTTFNNVIGDQFTAAFTSPFGQYSDLLSANYYTVQITLTNGGARTELRTYIMKDVPCKYKSFQLIFSNALGGFDTVTLFNPRESISSTKSSITNYPYDFNSAGVFTNINNGVYNDTATVINSTNTSSYKAITDVLNDGQANWLRSAITAEKVYLVLTDDTYLPVTLTTTQYNIQSKRLSSTNNRLELEFTSDVAGLFD